MKQYYLLASIQQILSHAHRLHILMLNSLEDLLAVNSGVPGYGREG